MATDFLEILTKIFLKSWVYVYQVWMKSVHYEASYSQKKLGRIKKTLWTMVPHHNNCFAKITCCGAKIKET